MAKKNDDGTRSVQLRIEDPGTPEEVWQAIATGPGIAEDLGPQLWQRLVNLVGTEETDRLRCEN